MSALSIAHYLRDFGAAAESGPARAVPRSQVSEADRAYARGIESGQAAARAELALKLEEQRKELERGFAAERCAHEEQIAKLAQGLSAGLSAVEHKIAAVVARLLEPFLTAQIQSQALANLHAALSAILAKEPAVTVTISGPEHLLAPVRARLGGTAAIHCATNDETEVRVAVEDTVLETRIGAWLAGLQEALG